MGWISKRRRANALSVKRLRELETFVCELQHDQSGKLIFGIKETTSITNCVKGLPEDLTSEVWDWWPLGPRERTLAAGEARMKWTCVGNLGGTAIASSNTDHEVLRRYSFGRGSCYIC
jgi:hypothetical protein